MFNLFNCFRSRQKTPLFTDFALSPLMKDPPYIPLTEIPALVEPEKPETLIVLSLDADGMVFNPRWVAYKLDCIKRNIACDNDSIFKFNRPLVGYILEVLLEHGVDSAQVMVGSMRQSKFADNHNIEKFPGTGSYFYWLEMFCNFFNEECKDDNLSYRLKLNRYLLSDTYSDTSHEFSFINALAGQGLSGIELIESVSKVDRGKFGILYAQMFKIATENPNKKIIYRFVDDHQETLDALYDIFRKNIRYLPPNVSLEIVRHYYNSLGEPVIDRSRYIIHPDPKNIMDECYEETLRKIANYAEEGRDIYFDLELQDEFQGFREKINVLRKVEVIVPNNIDRLHSLRKEVESLYAGLLEHYFSFDDDGIADCMSSVFSEIRTLYHIYIKESGRSNLEYSFEAMNDFCFMKLILSYVKNLLEGRFENGLVSGCSQSNIENIVKGKMGLYNTASLAYALNTLYNIIVFPTAPVKENLTPVAG